MSSIKFRKGFPKFMIPIALLEKNVGKKYILTTGPRLGVQVIDYVRVRRTDRQNVKMTKTMCDADGGAD